MLWGDMGGLLTFSLIGAFQNKFYTDVLHIQPGKIVVLILVARLWDAINDPIWGCVHRFEKAHQAGQIQAVCILVFNSACGFRRAYVYGYSEFKRGKISAFCVYYIYSLRHDVHRGKYSLRLACICCNG